MNVPMKLAAPVIAALTVAACSAGGSSNLPATAGLTPVQSTSIPSWKATGEAKQVCPDVPPGFAQCDVLLMGSKISDPTWPDSGRPIFRPPTIFRRPPMARARSSRSWMHMTIQTPPPTLPMYRAEFNLGKAKFVKYNEKGEKGNYPASCPGSQTGWCLEDDLDIEMVAAVCPKCTIYLIEANAANTRSLQTAEAEAVKLGAHIVSNSWGCTGHNDCVNPKFFNKPGVVYLASAGDYGYGTQAPAALASVISAGGTLLHKTGSSYTESVWPDTGVGCASGVTKPSWQHDPDCSFRTMNDVAAVAQGVAEYDTFGPYNGWFTVMGTSISSPLLASIFALAGNADKAERRRGLLDAQEKGAQEGSSRDHERQRVWLSGELGRAVISARPERSSTKATRLPTGGERPTESAPFRAD